MAVQVAVWGQRVLHPVRCLITPSGPKKLDQFMALDVHAHSFGSLLPHLMGFGCRLRSLPWGLRSLPAALRVPSPSSATTPRTR
jgi:hypothetical protein